MTGPKNKETPQSQLISAAGHFMGYGLTWALSTLLFLMAGWWFDGKVGTTPLFLILGAFVGGAAGFYSLYRHIVLDARKPKDDKKT